MTNKFRLPDGEQWDEAERIFEVLEAVEDDWQREGDEEFASVISPTRLYAYACNPDPTTDPELARLLATETRLGRDFARMLARIEAIALVRLAAAAGEAIPSRQGAGFRLRFEPSRVEPDQVYVIVECEGDDPTGSIIVVHENGRSVTQTLPPPQDGVIQILAEYGSELVTALADNASEVYLK